MFSLNDHVPDVGDNMSYDVDSEFPQINSIK